MVRISYPDTHVKTEPPAQKKAAWHTSKTKEWIFQNVKYSHLALLTELPFKPLFLTSDLWNLRLLRAIIFTLDFQGQMLGIFLHLSILTRWFFHSPLKVSFWDWWKLRALGKEPPSVSSPKFLLCHVPYFPVKELLPQTLQTSLSGLVLGNVC